jgi:hypothetical protein
MIAAVLIAVIAGAVVWWVARAAGQRTRVALAASVGVGLLPLSWAILTPERIPLERRDAQQRPLVVEEAGYVSSDVCIACHPGEHATWDASYHSSMTQLATPETVVGSFAGQQMAWKGISATLEREADEFWVVLRLPGEAPERRRIVMTTGSHNMQAYWTSIGRGRDIQRLPFVYLIEEKRWIPLDAAFLSDPAERIGLGTWDTNCSRCHTTNPRARTEMRDVQVSEFGISCEACHGPGGEHVDHYRGPAARYRDHFSEAAALDTINPSTLDHRRSSEVCGQCHGVRFFGPTEAKASLHRGYTYRPGDDLTDTGMLVRYPPRSADLKQLIDRDPALAETTPRILEEEVRADAASEYRFWPDGVPRATGAEFTAMMESGCYQRGTLGCDSCHSMHKTQDDPRSLEAWASDQLRPGMEGDQACLQCHAAYAPDVTAHTHHAPASSGSECQNCHMPFTTYGLLKTIRSHTIRSPSVRESVEVGRPNACNSCHLDKSLGWTAGHLEAWYGTESPPLDESQREIAASLLWLLRGDAAQRALVALSMGWGVARETSGSGWMPPFLAELLADPYDAVRLIAHRSLRDLEGMQALRYDFMLPERGRRRSQRRVRELWQESGFSAGPEQRAALLLDERGGVRRDAVESILEQRDDRSIVIWE